MAELAELEIDQTNLPRVQEVCQCFAVLEDGALAHNLQEQEIEQYYTTNIQKNQLVQNDIRVAKKMQDEEEEQWAQQSVLLRQASRQLEERDFEYARLIQEEILRCAEETQRREQDDEEIAKKLQEEEQQGTERRRSRDEGQSEGSAGDPALPHALSRHRGEEQYSPPTTRGQRSTSHKRPNLTELRADSYRGAAARRTSWSNEGRSDSFRTSRSEPREPVSEDSDDSDAVFADQLVLSQRLNERLNTAPPRRRAPLYQPHERKYRSVGSRSSFTDELRVWGEEEEEEEGERDEDYCENGGQERRPRNCDQQIGRRGEEAGERRCSRSASVRLEARRSSGSRELARTWSCKDNPDKRVHFRDDAGGSGGQRGERSGVWEMLGQVLKERGVAVSFGSSGAPLQIKLQRRDSQVLHGSEASCSDSRPHQRAFQRAAATRHSFHGDIGERRRPSCRENSGRDHREDGDRQRGVAEREGEVYEISSRDSYPGVVEGGGGSRRGQQSANQRRVKRTPSERWRWRSTAEERLSWEEEQEEVQGRREPPRRRAAQRSQSLSSSSSRSGWRHLAAAASQQPERSGTSLDLGELQQVLRDEELARTLQQQEEETLLRRSSRPPPSPSHPEGDFRVAQVAQDEEIAHFMQKQEIKSKRRSGELEGPASWREHRAMMSHHDRRVTRDRQVQRERLDSEGLPSPTEDCSPDNLPPSPTSSVPHGQQTRNIAEELDPTFQARRRGPESLGVGPPGPTCQPLPITHSGLNDFLEEPTFIPPTKRPADKSGRTKPKEKKENCKQQ